jgi:hypothetical protein
MGMVLERWCPTQQMLGVFLKENVVKKLLLTGTVVLLTATSALAQSAGVIMPGDKGRWHGYMPSGYIGAHPSNRGVRSCTWSIAASCAARRNGSYTRDGITHVQVRRPRDGKLVVRVYQGNTRVK